MKGGYGVDRRRMVGWMDGLIYGENVGLSSRGMKKEAA